jgi:hypothetical protein
MWVSVQRFGAVVVGLAALLTTLAPSVFGQQPPAARPAAPAAAPGAANPNIYANPLATAGRFGNTAVMGQALQNAASVAAAGTGSLLPGYGADGGYGTLSQSYANPGLGYGSLNNAGYSYPAGFGYAGGYGLGYAPQWMMNPYEGYLRGAADITRANADYYKEIQIATCPIRRKSARNGWTGNCSMRAPAPRSPTS